MCCPVALCCAAGLANTGRLVVVAAALMAMCLWGFAVWWLVMAVTCIANTMRQGIPFNLGMWGSGEVTLGARGRRHIPHASRHGGLAQAAPGCRPLPGAGHTACTWYLITVMLLRCPYTTAVPLRHTVRAHHFWRVLPQGAWSAAWQQSKHRCIHLCSAYMAADLVPAVLPPPLLCAAQSSLWVS